MPKEVIKLTNLNGMAPATNGGSLPISVSGIRADSIGGVVVPETIDSIDDIEATIGSDASAVGADYFVYSDYGGIMNVDNEGSPTPLGAFVPTEIDQVGDLVSLNKDIASYPQIISFKKPYCNDPIVQRPDIIMEEDKISAPGDMGHIKRIIPLNDNMSLVLVHGGQKLKIVFLADSSIGDVVYAKGDVLETGPLTFGYIVDLCADYTEVGNYCAYTSAYYIDSSSVDSAKFVRKIDISGWFTNGETFDHNKFIVANFTSLGRQVYGVELATDKVPTGAEVASIAVTNTKVFIGCSVPGDGITYSNGAWTYEIPEEKDLLFSIDKAGITDSALYATATFNGIEEVASGVVPLHSSMLPFMPYRHDKTNVYKTATLAHPAPTGSFMPYGFPIDDIAREFLRRWRNRLYPATSPETNLAPEAGEIYTFVYVIPGEAGIASTERLDEQTLSITGELVVMSYTDDMCGIYVSCNKPIVIPYDRATDWYGHAQDNSRLYWVKRDSDNAYFNGTRHSGAGLLGITLGYRSLGIIERVVVRTYNNWSSEDSYAHTAPPEKLAIFMWNGEQPRNSDGTEYEGEEYTFDVYSRDYGDTWESPAPSRPFGYNNGGKTWWIHQNSSFPDITWHKKKHFDTVTHYADVGVRSVVLVGNSIGEEESPANIKTTYFDPEKSVLKPVSLIARNDATMVYHSVGPAVIATPDTSGAVYPIHGGYIGDKWVSSGVSTIRPIALASNPGHTTFQYVSDDYVLTTADMTEGSMAYPDLPVITVDDGSAADILSLKGILSVESSEATASGLKDYAVRYKYSLTYDGFQEGPLSYFFVDAPKVLNGEDYKPFTVAVTVAIPGTIGKIISNRITGINIYAAQIENMQEIELYKLVDSIILDKYIFPKNTDTDSYNKVITDSGNRGASFESNSGYSETYETISLKRSCQCEFNGTLFVGNIEVLDNNFKMYTGNTVVKSLPGQPSVFDYSRDFAVMPFSPIVMRGHNNRLYVFGKNKYSIVNPDTMAVEHTSTLVGCEHKGHIVANEYGVFVYYRKKVYHINGMEVTDISKPIATTTTDIVTLADVDGRARLIFSQSRKALVLAFSDSSNTLHVFLYGLDDGNWVYYDISAKGSVFGAYERDGEAIILCSDPNTSTAQSLKLFGGTTNRSIELEWILDLAEDGHKSTIYDVRAYEDSDETMVDVYFDDSLFTEPYNGITKTKTRMKIVNSTRPEPGVVNNGMNNIKMIVRRYVAK